MFTGVRYDNAPKGDTVFVTVGLFDTMIKKPNGTPDYDRQVSYIADDRDTAANEANTKLMVAGEKVPLGDLLGTGMASKAKAASDGMAGEFVKSAVEALTDLLTEATLYAKYQVDAKTDTDRGAFDERLTDIADRAQEAIDTIFGTHTEADATVTPNIAIGDKRVNLATEGTLPREDTSSTTDYVRATQTVRGLNRLLDALSSADAFVDATKDGNNGVFENALGEDAARDAFSANKSEYTVYLGTTASTRYGAIALKERVSKDYVHDHDGKADTPADNGVEAAAVYEPRFAFDGEPATATEDAYEVGSVGAFSYANVNDTLRSRNLPQTGGAVYSGGTVAVTPAGTLYRGDMRIDVNFRQQSVFGRVSELKDKDNNLWKYLDSEGATIYLPKQNYNSMAQFGGMGANEDEKRAGNGYPKMATIVYASSPGFSTTAAEQPEDARFAGRFIGADGAEITGTWSLGQPDEAVVNAEDGTAVPTSNELDVIYGSYGVTRQAGEGPTGPADGTAGGAFKTTAVLPMTDTTDMDPLGATFEGDKDVAGILRLGKRSTGGGKDVNNDFDLKKIFAKPGADPKKTVNNSPKHVAVVVDHIKAQRAIYVIYAEQVGGDSADRSDLANAGRQSAWASINDFVLGNIFEKTLTPTDAAAPTRTENLSTPLGSYLYPTTRNGRPDDEAALERIDALLAAFDNVFAFEDALKDDGGGVFDSQPALDSAAGTADPFPLDTVDDVTAAGYNAEPAADIFNRVSSQTQLFSLSTDYTRFGVWYRRETDSAVQDWVNHASPDDGEDTPADTGSTSPGSYAYSWLSQSSYRTDRPVATYPSNGLATYEGRTLASLSNTQIYVGDVLVRVRWTPVGEDTTIVPIFSNIRKWQDGTLDRLIHGSNGNFVDEIVFRTSGGTSPLTITDDEGKLRVSFTDAQATVTYTDGSPPGSVASSTFMAKFVGSSGDGPLGVLGTFEVPLFAGSTTRTHDLVGSFGADLTSFEMPLP